MTTADDDGDIDVSLWRTYLLLREGQRNKATNKRKKLKQQTNKHRY